MKQLISDSVYLTQKKEASPKARLFLHPRILQSLEDQLHDKLHLPAAAGEQLRVQEIASRQRQVVVRVRHGILTRQNRRVSNRPGNREVTMVEGVEQFHSKLQINRLSEVSVFGCREIPDTKSRRQETIAACRRLRSHLCCHVARLGINSDVSD